MDAEVVNLIFDKISNTENLINIALVVLIVAAVFALIAIFFKAVRRVLIVVVILMCLSSAGFFGKAHSVLEDQLGVKIPISKVTAVVDSIREVDGEELVEQGKTAVADFLDGLKQEAEK